MFKNFFRKYQPTELPKNNPFEEKYDCILSHLENTFSHKNNSEDKIKYLIEIIIEYLNYSEAINSLSSSDGDPNIVDNSILFMDPFRKLVRELNLENRKIEIEPKVIQIKKYPILLNPWNGDRVIDNMIYINDENEFDGMRFQANVQNCLIEPLGIIVCDGANHSQFSARHRNIGNTIYNFTYNIENLYPLVEFDGTGFVKKDSSERIYTCNNEISFFACVIFELRRPVNNP